MMIFVNFALRVYLYLIFEDYKFKAVVLNFEFCPKITRNLGI